MDYLQEARAEIDALGGSDPGEYWEGYDQALEDAIEIIDRLRAKQSLAADVARGEIQIARAA